MALRPGSSGGVPGRRPRITDPERSRCSQIRLTCPHDETVDVDIHLLASADPESCLTRGHSRMVHDDVPGTYLMVVDTFVLFGKSNPGPYTAVGSMFTDE